MAGTTRSWHAMDPADRETAGIACDAIMQFRTTGMARVRGRVERSYWEMASASSLMRGMASVGNARRMVMARMADGHYG
ncbi:hypothetical protein E2562_004665 [Oryza meyeriana var. granulata]|uniref:Uncharacterized protein n=1 Tax=Oryza meyeriana var. granulata TaxID=110450 RepID=A0A6G1DG04_9ORYZ|nr:hypothetical protein E2562_004665 [Oryza meyeriana var. granulata]